MLHVRLIMCGLGQKFIVHLSLNFARRIVKHGFLGRTEVSFNFVDMQQSLRRRSLINVHILHVHEFES